jgi:hypothetical protein
MNTANRELQEDVISNSTITAIIADMDDLAAEHPDESLVIHNIFMPVNDRIGSRFLAEIEVKVWNYRYGRPKVTQAATDY